jgi:RsiW-degrading membrane proteinase PrsW (M82 family)
MIFLSLFLGLLPGFAWLVFYLSEDPHPEPKRLIALTFIAGIAFGFFTIIIEQAFIGGITLAGIPTIPVIAQEIQTGAIGTFGIFELILTLLGLAFIEEFMKFSAAYFAAGKSSQLDEPVDAMIYMIVAALGFATLENIGAITNAAAAAAQGTFIITAFQTASLRFVGGTLLHSLTSAIVGYHWALGLAKKKVPHYLVAGFIAATILHATFNYLILNYADVGYSILFLLVIGFFVLNDFEKLKAEEIKA